MAQRRGPEGADGEPRQAGDGVRNELPEGLQTEGELKISGGGGQTPAIGCLDAAHQSTHTMGASGTGSSIGQGQQHQGRQPVAAHPAWLHLLIREISVVAGIISAPRA